MTRRIIGPLVVGLLSAAPAWAQSQPSSLATLFEEVYGPRGLVVASQDVQVDGSNHAAHFNSAFQSEFRLVNIALTSQLAAIPLPSPASGFTYRFDPATGTFQRSTRSFGPILADRGETIGRGRLAFGFSHQYFSFDHLDSVPLVAVPAVFTHDNFEAGGGRTDVIGTMNTIKADVTQFSGALTYGVTDRLDISLAVPVVRTSLSLLSNATIHRVGTGEASPHIHYFPDELSIDGFGSTNQFLAEGSAAGIGDLVVRTKGTVLREGSRALAAGLDVRLPTGDERNLLGSGALGLRSFAAFSTAFGPIAPHVNIAYQWNGESVVAGDIQTSTKADLPDRFSYAIGGDYTVTDRFSIVADFTGQRVLDSPRLLTRQTVVTGPAGTVTLPDIRFETASYWISNGAIGFKANLAPRLLVNFNMRFAIGDNGLSDRIAPLLGFEWAF